MLKLKDFLVKVTCVFILLLIAPNLQSQEIDKVFPSQPKFLNFTNELPKTLFSGRTAVFVNSPCGVLTKNQKNWKQIAGEMHKGLRKAGIDAVAYYHVQDIFSGRDVSAAFSADMKKREIKNLIFIVNETQEHAPAGAGKFTFIITSFAEEVLVAHNQAAYRLENQDPAVILNDLYKLYSSSTLEKSNYLIIENPEFFEKTRINKGKRYEMFLSDLKIDKLAVPKFEEPEIPASKSDGDFNQKVNSKLKSLKEEAIANNSKLEGIMAAYPFKYEMVDPAKTEDQLRKAGFQYILLRIHASEKTIKGLLNYPANKRDDALTASLKGSKGEPEYKYYIKHIYSGDIYLGASWDAAKTWGEALEQHIHNMKVELKVAP